MKERLAECSFQPQINRPSSFYHAGRSYSSSSNPVKRNNTAGGVVSSADDTKQTGSASAMPLVIQRRSIASLQQGRSMSASADLGRRSGTGRNLSPTPNGRISQPQQQQQERGVVRQVMVGTGGGSYRPGRSYSSSPVPVERRDAAGNDLGSGGRTGHVEGSEGEGTGRECTPRRRPIHQRVAAEEQQRRYRRRQLQVESGQSY